MYACFRATGFFVRDFGFRTTDPLQESVGLQWQNEHQLVIGGLQWQDPVRKFGTHTNTSWLLALTQPVQQSHTFVENASSGNILTFWACFSDVWRHCQQCGHAHAAAQPRPNATPLGGR